MGDTDRINSLDLKIEDLQARFKSNRAVQLLNRVREAESLIAQSVEERQRKIKESITEISRRTDELHNKYTELESGVVQNEENWAEASSKHRGLAGNISELEDREKDMQDRLAKLEAEEVELLERQKKADQVQIEDMPGLRHELSLFANITNVSWDYNAKDIRGIVASQKDAIPFQFETDTDPKTLSDQLWQLIDRANKG